MPKLDRKKPQPLAEGDGWEPDQPVKNPEPQYAGGSLAESPEPLAQAAWEADLPEVQDDPEPLALAEEHGDYAQVADAAEDYERVVLAPGIHRGLPDASVIPTPEKTVVLLAAEPGTKAVLKAPVKPEERRPFDDYPTEPGWTRALLRSVEFEGTILEPASGAGWMVSVLQEEGHDVVFSDLERDGVDFLDRADDDYVDNVITNPPYKLLDDFIVKATLVARRKVALLLPDFSLVGVNRTKDIWQANPPAKLILVASKMKVLGKVSMFPHIWAVWDNSYHGPTQFEWAVIPKEERLDTSKLVPAVSPNSNTNK